MASAHVLVVEPWFGGSHRSWAEGLARHSEHDVHLVTHEDRFWRWRTRGSAVTLATEVRAHVAEHGQPDVLVVSSMVDLAALVGLSRRDVGAVPVLHYVHESQLVHPPGRGRTLDRDLAVTGWQNLVAADVAVFNSEFHRQALFDALPGFLHSFPDRRHEHLIDEVGARTRVLPVGIEVPDRGSQARGEDEDGPPILLWNHRWEQDKDPDAFAAALQGLLRRGVAFRLALVGEGPEAPPAAFEQVRALLGERVVAYGWQEPAPYRALLARSAVVVSTARHEFFGVAVAEAMAARCCPVLPRRLSYPELIPAALHDRCLYDPDDDGALVDALVAALEAREDRRRRAAVAARHVRRFAWSRVVEDYDRLLAELSRS